MSVLKKLQEVFDINESTLSGCVDIICIEQPDKTLKSSSFHVRFGKFKVLKSNEKIVTIKINDIIQKVTMKMDSTGEAYFEDIRDESALEKIFNAGLSSDDAFSDYEIPNMQSDDEGAFDKEKINEQISKNQYRFDDLVSPYKDVKEKEKEGKQANNINVSNQGQQTKEKEVSALPQNQNQPEQKKGGFWHSIFGGRKKQEDSISNQTSRKNSENPTLEELQKITQEQVKEQNISEVKQEGSTQLPSSSFNSNGVASSDIESEVDKFVINDEIQERSKNQQKNQNINNSKSQVSNSNSLQFKEDKYKMSEVVENLEKKKPSPSMEKKSSTEGVSETLERKESQKQLNTNQSQTNTQNSEKDKKKDGKDQNKIEMKDLIDQNKDLKDLISSKKQDKQQVAQQEAGKIQEVKEEGNEEEEDEEEEDEDEMEIGLSLCNNVQQKKGENKSLDQLFEDYKVTYEQFSQDPVKILNDKNLLLKIGYHLYPLEIASTILICRLAFKQEIPDNVLQNMIKQQKKKSSSGFLDFFFRRNKNESTPQQKPVEVEHTQQKDKTLKKDISNLQLNSGDKNDQQVSSPIQSPKSADNLDINKARKNSDELSVVSDSNSVFGKQKIRKTFRPKSDILKSFNLKPGANKISFTVVTKLLGEQTLEGYIYLWQSNVQIVISDIDGTITKSDVLGQIMPMLDKDWTHEGVISLYQNIVKNGYQILYLTARAIGQSEQTRKFIYNVKQENVNLPLGPVIMSSDRLLKSFKREVIDRKPEVFKIAVLREIQSLFPNKNVYYAGFGNRETDAVAYRAVQVSIQKIYIINPASELHQINNTFKKSYLQLNDMVDQVFPPIKQEEDQIQEEYNSFNFWKIKPPAVEDINQLLSE
ncbi:LNS2 (lipin/Ned1/SMP2) protein (macronuclear) [Tetrahymena thermophila SB210]|uniref:phosphatidate phosphatase n=1 Tax=Tetrahymena thermophila (strain SB210) TaxID=312017 RepID=I7MEH3_TETTS|nr:LNS2 (lipin/Ned1/SMP2) protein [Tetrahymena thermophila SB210]EAR96358.2 LNS2 (lipin/Ned1/SMP2) protein [Tetrahymena thermophila SB210]|eukprot:XP_001016603.2 LNS2 (lipin/Ned1/SMP2) protein [Tetrahymena thermophila SB210]